MLQVNNVLGLKSSRKDFLFLGNEVNEANWETDHNGGTWMERVFKIINRVRKKPIECFLNLYDGSQLSTSANSNRSFEKKKRINL